MKPILQIVKITGKFWKYYAAVIFFIVSIAALNLVPPLLNKNIVDIIVGNFQTGNADINLLITFLIVTVVINIVVIVFTNISGYLGDRLGARLKTYLMQMFYEHVLKLEIEYFDNEQTGKIVSKLQRGIENITSFINVMVNNFLPYILTALFTIGFLAFYSWEIAVLLAALFPIYILISDKSSKRWIAKQNVINEYNDKQFGRATEVIGSIRVVKSFISEKIESIFFKKQREEIEKLTKTQSGEYHRFDFLRSLIMELILFGIYAYIIYFTFQGRYSIGVMTLLLQLVQQARWPLFAMSFILGQIQSASSGSKDFFEVLAKDVKIKDKDDASELKDVKGKIDFKNVDFKYSTESKSNVLNGINFTLDNGQKMAIVGMSGEGKSTLTNLLLRFYEPQNGEITIDSVNIHNVTQESLHKNIGVVLQESLLFSGTIKENIKYGNPDASDEQVINAAKAANAHEFISNFENGYESEIGERGIKLSGGQKQRISIARAILKNAPILILDEATSSLDSKAEQEVQKALEVLMEGRTTIIIAHRLSTIKNEDKIIVLKGGIIEEQGSPSELAKKDGIYSELLKLQNLSSEEKPKNKKLKEFEISS